MRNRVMALLCAGIVTLLNLPLVGAEAKVEPLWPDGVPSAKGTAPGDTPTLTIYQPEPARATRTAIVICPGGGYGHLAMDHEGHQIGQWLNSLGVTGFILQYRHRKSGAGYGHPAPLQDAQRAIRTVRCRAEEWGIEPNRIGILGFSAGGHLTSTALTHYNDKVYPARDAIDKASARPDFGVLIYPVISFTEWFTHKGSRRNLLGSESNEELYERFSNEKQVTPETPPCFLIHTWEDTGVPAENSIAFYLALRKAKVPAEMHIFAKGRHGFGLGKDIPGTSAWPKLCEHWLKAAGFVD